MKILKLLMPKWPIRNKRPLTIDAVDELCPFDDNLKLSLKDQNEIETIWRREKTDEWRL